MATDIGGSTILRQIVATGCRRDLRYRERAAQLREMAVTEPIVEYRDQLADLGQQFEDLADRFEHAETAGD